MPRFEVAEVLRRSTGGAAEIPVAGGSVRDVLESAFARFPDLRPRTLDPAGRLYPYLLLLRNGAELPRDGVLDAPVGPDDVIELIGAAEGG